MVNVLKSKQMLKILAVFWLLCVLFQHHFQGLIGLCWLLVSVYHISISCQCIGAGSDLVH